MPNIHASLANAYNSYTSRNDRSPGVVDAGEAVQLIKIAQDLNKQSTGSCSSKGSDKGDQSLKDLVKAHGDKFDSEALKTTEYYLKNHRLPSGATTNPSAPNRPDRPTPSTPPVAPTSPDAPNAVHGKVILEWKSEKPTWHCHWWPMKATQPGGDAINNLYAPNGPLAKYDAAFGAQSRAHESANNAKAHNSSSEFDWWGHCNNASQAACLLKEPVRDVTMNGVTFTAHDISGLLCKVMPSLSKGEDFRGNRYNGPTDDPNDPNPYVFLNDVCMEWGGKDGKPIPFILDIDRTGMVWNYPYDQGRIYESDKAPAGVNIPGLPSGGKVKFYRAELKGTGFKEQERNYQFWIQYGADGKPMAQAWIAGEDPKINPDFAWRPHPAGNLDDPRFWVTNPGAQNNPFVKAEDVYKLYKASIA